MYTSNNYRAWRLHRWFLTNFNGWISLAGNQSWRCSDLLFSVCQSRKKESCSDEKALRNCEVYLLSRGRCSRRRRNEGHERNKEREGERERERERESEWNETKRNGEERDTSRGRNETSSVRRCGNPSLWAWCSKMNLSWTMPARSAGNFRGKLCEMRVYSLPNVARRSPSTFHPLRLPPFLFILFLLYFLLLLDPFLTFFRDGERGRITVPSRDSAARFYLILKCTPQLDEFSFPCASVAVRIRELRVFSSSCEMFGERIWGGELKRRNAPVKRNPCYI